MLAAGECIQAGVGGDPVEPGAKRSSLERVEAAPGAQIGFLHEVLGVVQGAKHAITMQFDLAAERLGEPFKPLLCGLRPLLLT